MHRQSIRIPTRGTRRLAVLAIDPLRGAVGPSARDGYRECGCLPVAVCICSTSARIDTLSDSSKEVKGGGYGDASRCVVLGDFLLDSDSVSAEAPISESSGVGSSDSGRLLLMRD